MSATGARLTTAIVGVGNIGGTLARHLVAGSESVVLAAKNQSRAQALAVIDEAITFLRGGLEAIRAVPKPYETATPSVLPPGWDIGR